MPGAGPGAFTFTGPRVESPGRIAMIATFFVSDLHGRVPRYESLFAAIERERPGVVLLGGDLLPQGFGPGADEFLTEYLSARFRALRSSLRGAYPRVFAIFGNDDARVHEAEMRAGEGEGLWEYVHVKRVRLGGLTIVGYSYVPPTPFRLKDWERYDVGRYVDPGSISPEDGVRSVAVPEHETRWATIAADLADLTLGIEPRSLVMLVHGPPHGTMLDRAALDGVMVDHAPSDVHVGSIALRRFIEAHQPRLTLHGHIHESARLTGHWRDRIGETEMLSAAHDGPELALIRLDLDDPTRATRELVKPV
ncbi:MAG: metallophosphoesterase [Acidobacteria bacterium]|nr:metallophosphoesterase [Acidobacteriota bacterium]